LPGLAEQAAVDGKTVRGAVRPDGSQVHLLSLFDVTSGCVRAQREIDAKTNEIPELAPAIAHLDLIGSVVTADALCRRRHNASYEDPVVMPTCVGTCRRPSGKRVTRSA
jgi:hypothetical protein